jgi:hypothetical protein
MDETQLVDQAIHSPIAQQISVILGEIWWLFVVVAAFMMFKETLKSFVAGVMVLRGGEYNLDDIIILEDSPAKIVRKGIWKTTFYVYHINEQGKMFFTERSIMNEQLPNVKIEIPQQRMDQIIPAGFFNTKSATESENEVE